MLTGRVGEIREKTDRIISALEKAGMVFPPAAPPATQQTQGDERVAPAAAPAAAPAPTAAPAPARGATKPPMRQLREHSTIYLTKLWQLTVDRTGERDNTEARQRLQVAWAETKRRLGTHGRNAKRQLMPGWVVVAKVALCQLKHQLAA